MVKFPHRAAKIGVISVKKIIAAILLITIMAVPAFAKFSSKGAIPGGEPVEYRGLVIRDTGASIVLINRSETQRVTFSGAVSFLVARKEVADFFIEKVTLEPLEQLPLEKLYVKGDAKAAKKAEQLRWTIYTLEKK